MRLSSIGNRGSKIGDTTELGNFGFKGTIGESNWTWDTHVSYGKLSLLLQQLNYLNFSQLAPSLTCTTAPGTGNCTPIDIFNQGDPTTVALLKAAKIDPFRTTLYQMKSGEASVANSALFSLPAGDVGFAA